MLETWSAHDILENRRGMLAPGQAQRVPRGAVSRELVEADLRAGRVTRIACAVDDWGEITTGGPLPPEPRPEGLLPGPYWFYVLPSSWLVVGFEARADPEPGVPLPEGMESVAKYQAAVSAANGLTPQEFDGLRRGELPRAVIERVDKELCERRKVLLWTVGIVLAVLLLSSAFGRRSDSDGLAVAWVATLGICVPLAVMVLVVEARMRALLRMPVIAWAQGELEKTSDKYRPFLLRVPGSPKLVVSADQYSACREGRPHDLAWLRGTHHGVAVFYAGVRKP